MIEQSVHTPSKGVKQRVYRGLADVERVAPHGDYYGVESSSRPGVVHRVTLTHLEIGEVCECEDWRGYYRRYQVSRPCRHIYAATLFEARNNCRRGPKIIRH